MENNLLLKKARACVYGPHSLGGRVNQKGQEKPLLMRPDTSRSKGKKNPFKKPGENKVF